MRSPVPALLGALTVAAVVGPGLLVPVPAQAADCQVGTTHYIDKQSYALARLGVSQSWGLATGRGETVAVVDSGVDVGNAHLGRRVVERGTSFVPGFPDADQDYQGHGTGVAGIIAARPVGRSALVGVAPDARILPVRVYVNEDEDPTRTGPLEPNTERMAQGIRWAALHGADVINVSMSTKPDDPALPDLQHALAVAHRHDVVVVASGGNQTVDKPLTESRFPAAGAHVIGVAASNDYGVVDDWSIHGPQNDVSAPGGHVLIAFHANGDCEAGGDRPFTSWAAAFVSGLAAQLRQRYPHETADQIAYRITASADRARMSTRDDLEGWGEIRPYDALTMSLDPRRPGPTLPGATRPPAATPVRTAVAPLAAHADPLAPARVEAMWWAMAAAGLCALALVLRPWVGRLSRRTPRGRRRSRDGESPA